MARGGTVTLYYDGKPVGTGRVGSPFRWRSPPTRACDVGRDTGSPASPDYGPTDNEFTGTIDWLQIDIGDDGQDHLITPEDRLQGCDGQAVVSRPDQSLSQRGVMNTPSASTVMPSASEIWPAQNVFTPSVRVIAASACNGPNGVARR